MIERIIWFFKTRPQLRKMRKLGLDPQDLQLFWAHEPDQKGIFQENSTGCIVGRAAAATAKNMESDVVAMIYPSESGRWVVLESADGWIVGWRETAHDHLAQAQAEALRKYRFVVQEEMIDLAEEAAVRRAREAKAQAMAEELSRGES